MKVVRCEGFKHVVARYDEEGGKWCVFKTPIIAFEYASQGGAVPISMYSMSPWRITEQTFVEDPEGVIMDDVCDLIFPDMAHFYAYLDTQTHDVS